MKNKMFTRMLSALSLIAMLLAACAPAQTPPPATLAPTSTPLPTRQPTSTPLPTATLTPIPSVTPTQTQTPLPTPPDDAAKAHLFAQGERPGYEYFLTIEFPEAIQGSYYAQVDQNKPYQCSPISDQKNRLYCYGRIPGYDKYFTFTLYDQQTDLEVYSTRFFVPLTIAVEN